MTDAIDLFRDAIAAAGLTPPESIEPDGALHRHGTNGARGDDAGWYILHTDGIPAGAYGCHRADISHTWCARSSSDMSATERRAHRERMDAIRRTRQTERERRYAEARTRAAEIWARASPETGQHRYLRDRGVQAYVIRSDGERLVIPMRDTEGMLHSIQYIDPRSGKRYLTGGRVSGCYHAIGRPDGTLCIAEGYATGASVHEATGHAVAVAFSAGNLEPVARALRAKYPDLRMIVCADDDAATDGNPGLTAATAAARAVGGLLAVPDFGAERPDGATDFNDLHRARGLDAVRDAVARATASTDSEPAPPSDDAPADTVDSAETIARLAGLSSLDYDRCRQAEAERLGVRVGTLDAEVSRLRPQTDSGNEAGAAVLFDEPAPWPHAVDGVALLDELVEAFNRYLALPAGASHALALWTAHTHLFEAFECTPRLNITAPQKQCGKTLVLDVLQPIIAKGLRTESVSTAVLFRLVDKETPTLLIDECDSFLRDNEELRGALNAGHRRGGRHLRCEGDQNEVRAFKTFAPVVLAGIGTLPGTLADRSIIIRMERAKPGEVPERFDSRKTASLQALKRKLTRFAHDHRADIDAADPDTPGLYNRRADNWRPLFAIAAVVGGEWPQRVTAALTALTSKADENESAGVLLLADIRQLFRESGRAKLASTYLIDRLTEMDERPWPEFRRGKAITKIQVANLLRPFRIVSGTRRDAGEVFRGYEHKQFINAFARYLPDENVTTLHPASQSHSDENRSVTNGVDVTSRKTPKPAPHNGCNVVTDREAGGGAKAWAAPTYTIIPRGNDHDYDDAEVF